MPTFFDILLEVAPYIIGLVIGLVGVIIVRLSKQRKLMRLLGIDKNIRRVNIYLSSLFVRSGHGLDFRGVPRTYEGITVPNEEFSAGTAIPGALNFDPFENIPPIIRKQIQEKWPFFKPISFSVNASPFQVADIDFSSKSIITLGSHGYNIVSDYCNTHGLSKLHITQNGTVIEIVKGKHKGEIIRPVSRRHDIAILEKVTDGSRDDATILIAAGLGVIGTMGATNYFLNHWQELHKAYDEREFALVLQFGPVGSAPLSEILKGNVIRRLPEY